MAATNPGQHRSQLRHLELHAWAVRDLVREGQVQLEWVSTEENPSDLLTKAIGRRRPKGGQRQTTPPDVSEGDLHSGRCIVCNQNRARSF